MVKFGPSGNDINFYEQGFKHTIDQPKWLQNLGLSAYEYSFGKGITLSDETALAIGKEMKKYGIEISVHAPYYINFATPLDEMAIKGYYYVINSIKKLQLLGGNRIVVHPASVGKMSREDAVALTRKRLETLSNLLAENNMSDILICLETMGKQGQIGTYKEIIDFCTIAPNFIPTFDFGHINALTGGSLKLEDDYLKIFDYCLKVLGFEKTNKVHIHFSKIEFSSKGEVRHLTLEDDIYGPEFLPLAKAIKKLNLNPVIICESKEIMAMDALKLKSIYENA